MNALVQFSQVSELDTYHLITLSLPSLITAFASKQGAWLRVSGMRPFPSIPSPLGIHPDDPIRAFLWINLSLLT